MDTTRRWWGGHLLDIPEDECWELLAATTVGRIAWCEAGGPVVLPVNIAVHDGAIWMRTRAHSAMAAHTNHGEIAVQVDEADEFNRSGWSVLARGHAELVAYALGPASMGDPDPWPEGARPLLIKLEPATVTGRRLLAS
jgi:hypothetical protein